MPRLMLMRVVSLADPINVIRVTIVYSKSSNEAAVAQLVEHHVAKSEVNATTYVDESSLVSRSKML